MSRTTTGVRSGYRRTGASRPGSRIGAIRFGASRFGGGAGTRWLPGFDPGEMMQSWNDAVSAWQTSWGDLIDRWPATMPQFPSLTPAAARRRSCPRCGGEHCEPCGADDCHCDCCVNDADVIIEARVGERRVISVIVENDTRRPTEVKAELSAFTT